MSLRLSHVVCGWPGTTCAAQDDLNFMIFPSPPLECWDYKHVASHRVKYIYKNGFEYFAKMAHIVKYLRNMLQTIQSTWLYSNTLISICLKVIGTRRLLFRKRYTEKLRIFYYKLLRTGQEVLGHQKQGVSHKTKINKQITLDFIFSFNCTWDPIEKN